MTAASQQADLDARLAALSRSQGSLDPKDLVEVVESIMATMEGDVTSVNVRFYAEIEALARYIQETKSEIASLRPDEITDTHLPAATDELEAVVGATEKATESIFEAVEKIEELTAGMDEEVSAKVVDAVTMVYEACSFQDITGQRITKVVNALKHIEAKVEALLEAFGSELKRDLQKAPGTPAKPVDQRPDGDLMNGPQLPEDAQSQDDIDALLASLD
ncbi:MAG: protein phosphatase CheZ [Kiloniellales bacterium]|nr:protein phosphatase CheZ [Kiloniellales bacterium]